MGADMDADMDAVNYPTTFPEECTNPAANSNLTLYIAYAYTWMYTKSEIRTFTIGLPIALVTGVLGNCVFLFVVAKVERLHNITNYYLVNLAFADISFVISSIGPYLYTYKHSPVRHDVPYQSSLGCILVFGISNTTYYASIGLVTLVTLERYYGICFPFQHRAISSKNRTKKLIAGTWIVGVILSGVRTLKYAKLYRYCTIWPHLEDFIGWPQTSEFCWFVREEFKVLSDLTDIIPFVVALFWNGYMYARIIYSLSHREIVNSKQDNAIADERNPLQVQAAKITKQVARMLIINGILFFICQVFNRLNPINDVLRETAGVELWTNSGTFDNTMLVFGRCMLYVNSAINPSVYFLTNGFYRKAFQQAFASLRVFGGNNDIEISKATKKSTETDSKI